MTEEDLDRLGVRYQDPRPKPEPKKVTPPDTFRKYEGDF